MFRRPSTTPLLLGVFLAAACGGESTAPPPSTPNQRPVGTNTIPAQELRVGDTLTVDASSYFTDPDGDALTFSTETSNRSVASAAISAAMVAVVGVAPGEARITIRARDPAGQQAVLHFNVLVPFPATADQLALEALYRALGGDAWVSKRNWLTGRALDTWHGVELNEEGRVSGLNLELNNLTGELPPVLGDLGSLRSLNLARNELTGGIPPAVGRLGALSTLRLNGNDLSGEIPPHLGDLGSLNFLHLNNNRFSGTIPAKSVRCSGCSTWI